jgi:hypothetical protein
MSRAYFSFVSRYFRTYANWIVGFIARRGFSPDYCHSHRREQILMHQVLTCKCGNTCELGILQGNPTFECTACCGDRSVFDRRDLTKRQVAKLKGWQQYPWLEEYPRQRMDRGSIRDIVEIERL